jgi:hypothetical protein
MRVRANLRVDRLASGESPTRIDHLRGRRVLVVAAASSGHADPGYVSIGHDRVTLRVRTAENHARR